MRQEAGDANEAGGRIRPPQFKIHRDPGARAFAGTAPASVDRRNRQRRRPAPHTRAGRLIAGALQLRAATDADLRWVRELARHETVARSLSTTAAHGLVDAIAAGELWIAETPSAERVGVVRVRTVNRRSRIASIETLIVHPEARGRGLGVEILRAVTRDAFSQGIHRLEGEVYAFNEPALRTFEAAGFTREGVRRRAYDRHGAWQDGVRFGLLADE